MNQANFRYAQPTTPDPDGGMTVVVNVFFSSVSAEGKVTTKILVAPMYIPPGANVRQYIFDEIQKEHWQL